MAEDPEELKRNIEQSRRKVGRDVDVLTEKVSPSAVVGRRVERARGGVHRLKEHVMGVADSVSGSVTDTVGSAPGMARAKTHGTPLAAGLVAFAAGWMVSAALPASTQERELAQETKDKVAGPVKEQATQLAQELKDDLQEPAQQAVASVKQTASQAAAEVADDSRSAAQQVADGAKESADKVR